MTHGPMEATKVDDFLAYESTYTGGIDVSSFWNAANDVLLVNKTTGDAQIRKTFRVTTTSAAVVDMPM